MRFRNYSIPQITKGDIETVAQVLRKNEWLAGNGLVTRQFEKAIAEYTGYEYAIAVNSATSGLFVAYLVSFSNMYVRVPALTFIASANMVLAVGLEPMVLDILEETWTAERYQAQVPVSFAGYPVRGGQVADDAHYLCPNMANHSNSISVISTHALKHITSGEGGVILTNDKYLYGEMSKLVDQGRGVGNSQFGWGYNFRMADINAALALSQLERYPETLAHKRRLAQEYYRLLKGSSLTLPPHHRDHAWHLFVTLVPKMSKTDHYLLTMEIRSMHSSTTMGDTQISVLSHRDFIAHELRHRGINTGHHYPPLYTYDHLAQYKAEDCPVSEMVWDRGISLPLYPDMTLDDISFICENLLEILG